MLWGSLLSSSEGPYRWPFCRQPSPGLHSTVSLCSPWECVHQYIVDLLFLLFPCSIFSILQEQSPALIYAVSIFLIIGWYVLGLSFWVLFLFMDLFETGWSFLLSSLQVYLFLLCISPVREPVCRGWTYIFRPESLYAIMMPSNLIF